VWGGQSKSEQLDSKTGEGWSMGPVFAAKRSPFVLQTLTDILNMPITIATTEQICAFGAAMFAAVVGGMYSNVEDAQKAMVKGFEKTYMPNPKFIGVYDKVYKKYISFGTFIESNY
jgi:L-ribulokinase